LRGIAILELAPCLVEMPPDLGIQLVRLADREELVPLACFIRPGKRPRSACATRIDWTGFATPKA
jgi:hypothetical protein